MSRENLGTETLEQLFKQSGMDKQTKQKFLDDLDAQLSRDNHDMALDERLEIISTCFNKCIKLVVMQIPEPEEQHEFKMCIRKFGRVKMRAVSYYHGHLHADEDYIYKNIRMLRPFMSQ